MRCRIDNALRSFAYRANAAAREHRSQPRFNR
jgi:hypothetical protein